MWSLTFLRQHAISSNLKRATGLTFIGDQKPRNIQGVWTDSSLSTFTNDHGEVISYKTWCRDSSETRAAALLVISHGYGGHSGRWKNRGERWAERGFMVTCHDHVGHGLSCGRRAHVTNYRRYTDVLLQHTINMRERNPGLPVFGIGHSMGGLVMLKLALEQPDLYDGIILSSVPLATDRSIYAPAKLRLLWLLHKVFPTYGVLNMEQSAEDEKAERSQPGKDSLFYRGKMTAGFLYASYLCAKDCRSRLEQLTAPLLVIHGTNDRVSPIGGAYDIIQRAGSRDKEIKVYDAAHSLFKDPHISDRVFRDCTDWIEHRL